MKMKNKKAEQKDKRNQLRKQRKLEKGLERKSPVLEEKPTFLIVCEGRNTEPSYFNNFKLSSAIIKSIGEGYNTLSLVKRAITLSEKKNYDQVWCVFDKDDFTDENFNNAILLASKNNIGIAYSNQAFEYWILLHFNNHQGGAIERTRYNMLINKELIPFNLKYDGKKSKVITDDIFDILEAIDENTGKVRRTLAIERAKNIYSKLSHEKPAQEESSTTVFKLVEEFEKYR